MRAVVLVVVTVAARRLLVYFTLLGPAIFNSRMFCSLNASSEYLDFFLNIYLFQILFAIFCMKPFVQFGHSVVCQGTCLV